MRLLFLTLFLLAACTTVPVYPPPMAPSAPAPMAADLISKTVALVEPQNGGGVRAYCSGVWLSSNTIVTANHCTQGEPLGTDLDYVVHDDVYPPADLNERVTVVSRRARLVAVDVTHDVALLFAAYPPAHGKATITMEPVRQGHRVHSMGAPLGQFWSYSSGDVSAVRYVKSIIPIEAVMIQSTTPISGGNSGGGLFNDFGELVGICHASFTRGQNMNLWIHYQYVDALLRKSS